MKDRQPPSDDQIKEYVKVVIDNSDLAKITMREVCSQVMMHYSDFDLAHKRDVIRSTVRTIINAKPANPPEEPLPPVEENSEVAVERNNEAEIDQKWEAAKNDLNKLEDAASRAPRSWAEAQNGSHSRPQPSRVEEERTVSSERANIEENSMEPTSTMETQDGTEELDANGDDVDADSVESEGEECSSEYCNHRPSGAAGGRAPPRRGRRPRSARVTRPARVRPLTVLQRMIRLEERHLSLTRDNAIALNHVADSVDRLANFITECSRRIAGDLERRITPN
ncbi:hypothetical protein PYW07_009488 [Mythimna separata]|uniref:DEK-C domain-containing protein n=1 Tax=Mythimna separata TaxID=271217 RepID=A0AAD8DNC5_MYTSE|nr:hypothetical protein PYW07_009488 [Mythimna separata]